MKTKEELIRIYSAYLPYGLLIETRTDEEIKTDESYISKLTGVHYDGLDHEFGNNWDSEVRPLLYDLSYLTKEIEHEGKKIIPIVELAKIGTREEDCYVTNENIGTCYVNAKYQKKGFFIYHPNGYFMWQVGKSAEPLTVWNQHELFQKLYEWHFNVFHLPEDQYINKANLQHGNTTKNN